MAAEELTIEPALDDPFPPEVELIISALEAAQPVVEGRRKAERASYRVRGRLRLFSDTPDTAPWLLFTRDVNPRGMGFLCSHRLPLGYGGLLEIPDPEGRPLRIHCTLLRCRQVAPGWHEGAVYFNREQHDFAVEE